MHTVLRLIRSYELKMVPIAPVFIISTVIVCFCEIVLTRITGNISQAALELNTALIYEILLLMAAINMVKIIFGMISALTIKRFGGRLQYMLRGQFAKRMNGIPYDKLISRSSGDILSVYTSDLPMASNVLADDIPQLLSEFITLLISAAFMAFIHPWYTLIFFLMYPPLTLLQVKISEPVGRHSQEASVKRGIYNATVNDSFQNTSMIIAYSLESVMEDRYKAHYGEYFAAMLKRIRVHAKLIIGGMIASFAPSFFIFFAAALSVASGRMPAGDFVALTILCLGANTFLLMLSQRLSWIQTNLAAARRLLEASADEPEDIKNPSVRIDPAAPAFEFANVSFTYKQESERRTLEQINLSIPSGSHIAIVGSSGCGKSTLMKLMLSLYKQSEGSIRMFGADTETMSLRQIRELIAYVPQDSFLFPESIRENITCVRTQAGQDEEDLIRACRNAGILSFIEGLPKGFDTVLTESADNVSGGQRQRLAVARALYKDAPILLLDEATSGLDPVTEQKLLESLYTSARDKTIIVVAHRLSAITACEHIIVMDMGHIVETGTYEELMAKDSHFAALYRQQIENGYGISDAAGGEVRP